MVGAAGIDTCLKSKAAWIVQDWLASREVEAAIYNPEVSSISTYCTYHGTRDRLKRDVLGPTCMSTTVHMSMAVDGRYGPSIAFPGHP